MSTAAHTARKTRRVAVVVSPKRPARRKIEGQKQEIRGRQSAARPWREEPRYASYCTDWYMAEETVGGFGDGSHG